MEATCQKCGVKLERREIEVAKGKCIWCIIKGYKFALSKMHRELEKAGVKSC